MNNISSSGEAGISHQSEAMFDGLPSIFEEAVYRSKGAAIVNVGDLNQAKAVFRLPGYYHHVTVDEILSRQAFIPPEKTALVVTGYSGSFYSDPDKENTIEAFIIAQAATRDLNSGRFSILVLSDTMPDENILHDPSLPWFNGPFQDDDSVWSIKLQGSRIVLVRHNLKSEIVREGSKVRKEVKWIDKVTFPFQI